VIIGKKSRQAYNWYKEEAYLCRKSFHSLLDIIFAYLYDKSLSPEERLKRIRDLCEEAYGWVLPYDLLSALREGGIVKAQEEQVKDQAKMAEILSKRGNYE
jgi:hypothetical protein